MIQDEKQHKSKLENLRNELTGIKKNQKQKKKILEMKTELEETQESIKATDNEKNKNKIELFVVRWLDLESVIQSEVSQQEKNKYSMLTHIYGI